MDCMAPTNHETTEFERDPIVVLAADENFAMPLAATIRSALDNLSPDRKLRLFIFSSGLSDDTKKRLEHSWPNGRYQITWVTVDASMIADLPISTYYNHTAYYRILMPWLLPKHITRAIYLDADMIVRADVGRLWDESFDGHSCMAVQDLSMLFIDAPSGIANYDRCQRHLGLANPVANYRELGLDPRAPYLNSGLMVVDISAWRNDDVANRLLSCLRENSAHVKWADQYALNVVFCGRWKQLDRRWNQAACIFRYPSWRLSPFDSATLRQLREDPYVIHFTTGDKPWLATCLHPSRKLFYEYVDRTAWAGWRPSPFANSRTFVAYLKAHRRRVKQMRKRVQSRLVDWFRQQRGAVAASK